MLKITDILRIHSLRSKLENIRYVHYPSGPMPNLLSEFAFSLSYTLSCYASEFINDIIIEIINVKPSANVREKEKSNDIYKAYFLTFICIDITFLSFSLE